MQSLTHSSSQSGANPLPWSGTQSLLSRFLIAIGASLFVAVAAHCTVPLPFTPVPLTLGDLAVLLVGLFLGPQMAFSALAIYLAEGAAGLPVFASTGTLGLAHLLGPTGGYLMAYPFAAALAGWLSRVLRNLPTYSAAFVGSLAASSLLMATGALWLSVYLHHSASMSFRLAVLPFLPGQVVKIVSAAGIYSASRPLRR